MLKFPRDQYEKLAKNKPIPYCFEIKKRNQALFYFGANHSHNPKDKQYPALKKYWQKFLALPNKKKLVMVEGGPWSVKPSEELAAKYGGENSFITFLAHHKHVRFISPEPREKKIDTSLRKKFSEDHIQYYYFAVYVNGWHHYKTKPNFKTWIVDMMTQYAKRHSFKNFTFERMKKMHRQIFKEPFNHQKKSLFNAATNPNKTKTVINKVAKFSSDLRDAAIIERIQKEWKSGKDILVVYGSGHAFIQEAILKRTLS